MFSKTWMATRSRRFLTGLVGGVAGGVALYGGVQWARGEKWDPANMGVARFGRAAVTVRHTVPTIIKCLLAFCFR